MLVFCPALPSSSAAAAAPEKKGDSDAAAATCDGPTAAWTELLGGIVPGDKLLDCLVTLEDQRIS